MANPTTSWTAIQTYRQCPHKYKLQYVDRWKPPTVARPLALGIMWHDLLDRHYNALKDGGIPEEAAVEWLTENGAKDFDHEQHEFASKCAWMYDGYRVWARQLDAQWEIETVEDEFRVPLPGTDITLVGRIDLVITSPGRKGRTRWVVDHKAVKNLPNNKELELDDQTPLYIWALRQAGWDVQGAMLSYSRTDQLKRPMTEQERFHREYIYKSSSELECVAREAVETATAAHDMDQPYTRHPDPQSCKWRCPFMEPCIGGRHDADMETQLLQGLGFYQSPPRLQVVKDEG